MMGAEVASDKPAPHGFSGTAPRKLAVSFACEGQRERANAAQRAAWPRRDSSGLNELGSLSPLSIAEITLPKPHIKRQGCPQLVPADGAPASPATANPLALRNANTVIAHKRESQRRALGTAPGKRPSNVTARPRRAVDGAARHCCRKNRLCATPGVASASLPQSGVLRSRRRGEPLPCAQGEAERIPSVHPSLKRSLFRHTPILPPYQYSPRNIFQACQQPPRSGKERNDHFWPRFEKGRASSTGNVLEH